MGLKLFNKIIHLEFLDVNGNVVTAIKCPKRGRKPSIEITGQFVENGCTPAINIRVKNLYIEEIGDDFPAVRVTAGYDDSTSTFDCSVFNMYQEAPGPESVVVIQATLGGELDKFLNNTVSGLVQAGGSLEDAIKLVSDALDFNAPSIDKKAAKLKTETQLCLDGTAREALKKIKAAFPSIVTTIADNKIKVYSLDDPSQNAVARIDYMSAPVQLTGGKGNVTFAVVTGPWVPSLRCGEPVEFPTKFYAGKTGVSSSSAMSVMTPQSIQFQFSTTGTANKMVVEGTVAKQGE